VYRFLLTVAIALVVWALLAGLAALLGSCRHTGT
jgi:hypothetical protein